MPKAPPPAVSFRQPQSGRPPSDAAPTQAQGPRALLGAMSVPLEQLIPDPDQPRRVMDDESLRELAASMATYGVLQPLLVREDGYLDDERARYRIVAGGRRYAAALLVLDDPGSTATQKERVSRLPVVVKNSEGAELRITQLVENIQRQGLAPLEEARAFTELMDVEALSAEALGERLGISGQKVRDRLLVLTDQVVSDAVHREQIPASVAAEILRLPEAGKERVRTSLDAGKTVDRTTVRALRDELKAAGVANPRAKGGGRPRKALRQAPPPLPDADNYQCGIDNEPVVTEAPVPSPTSTNDAPVRPEAALDGLDEAVEGLNIMRLTMALQYGIDRQWTCQELLQAIREQRSASDS